jgi:hypothetical protein
MYDGFDRYVVKMKFIIAKMSTKRLLVNEAY